MNLVETKNGPNRTELNCIRPGIFVRLLLDDGQTFWARTIRKREVRDKTFRGVVETQPESAPSVHVGDTVIFSKYNVVEIA